MNKLTKFNNTPLIIWGTGQLTLKLLAQAVFENNKIVALVDSNPINHGKLIDGIKIVSPDYVKLLPPYPIVIGSMLHHANILNQISNDLVLTNPIVTLT